MTGLIFNPYWHVPAKIAKFDIASKLSNNPDEFDGKGFKVSLKNDTGAYYNMDLSEVDYNDIKNNEVIIRQDPGIHNSLGLIRFSLQTDNNIYLHGTPYPEAFSKHIRALSSGCVRLEDPLRLAYFVLSDDSRWSQERIKAKYEEGLTSNKPETLNVKLEKNIPVYIIYQTIWYDFKEDKLIFGKDIYKMDKKILSKL